MNITSIISAIGNNSSVAPLFVRDCGIENPVKVYLTYKENKNDKQIQKLAVRERLFDEYAGSAVWLGGVPLVEKIANKIILMSGYNPNVNVKLLKEELGVQGLEYNINEFKGKVPEAVLNDLKKLGTKDGKRTYKNILACKFAAATLIPIAFIGFILPKVIFASSAKKLAQLKAQQQLKENKPKTIKAFEGKFIQNKNQVSFKGNLGNMLSDVSSKMANFSTLQKMEVIDGGYALGRVATARKGTDGNRNEAKDIAFKMAGMMYLNYVAPTQLEKLLNWGSLKMFKLNLNLDPLMLQDKEFIKKIADGTLELPKSNEAKDLLNFVDTNPNSLFVKYANKFEKIKMLENGVRDPRFYVDTNTLAEFKQTISEFAQMAKNAAKNSNSKEFFNEITKFTKRAKAVKTVNILANVGISSFLLAYCLPKAQYAFRRLVTGSELEPGIVNARMEEIARKK